MKERIANLPPPRPTPEREWFLPPISTPRVRLTLRRKKLGIRCLYVSVSEEHIDALIRLGFLPPEQRTARPAIKSAVDTFLHSSLVEKYQNQIWAKIAREQREHERLLAKQNR
jgi:hypothetical protein